MYSIIIRTEMVAFQCHQRKCNFIYQLVISCIRTNMRAHASFLLFAQVTFSARDVIFVIHGFEFIIVFPKCSSHFLCTLHYEIAIQETVELQKYLKSFKHKQKMEKLTRSLEFLPYRRAPIAQMLLLSAKEIKTDLIGISIECQREQVARAQNFLMLKVN